MVPAGQTRKSAAASANPGACVRLIGSRGTADDGSSGQRTEGGVLYSERIRSWLTTARTWSCSLQRGAAGYHVHNNSALGVYNLGMVTLNPY